MNIKKLFVVVYLFVPVLCHSQDLVFLNENAKKEIINNVSEIVESKFLYEEYAKNMAVYIKNEFDDGAYNRLSEVNTFCKRLTSDLRKIYNDKHLFVFHSPEEAYEIRAFNKLLPKNELDKFNELMFENESKENFGFEELKILEGNIGYLKLSYFSSPQYFDEMVDVSMLFLTHTDAIIVDLRNNRGGQGSSLLASYFLPSEEILLSSTRCRDFSANSKTNNQIRINAKRFLNKDLFILTNSNTFSAAEDFTYTMKHLNRATIVGEKTKGGAHPVDILNVYDDVLIQLPICESYNPITKGNWEGIGVIPDIPVISEKALNIAHKKAIENLISINEDIGCKEELEIILKNLFIKTH